MRLVMLSSMSYKLDSVSRICLKEITSILSTRIWAFSPSTYLNASGHTSIIFCTRMPSSSGLSTLILSVNFILSAYFISSYSGLAGAGATFVVVLPLFGIGMFVRKVFTIFLNERYSLSARSYIHCIKEMCY